MLGRTPRARHRVRGRADRFAELYGRRQEVLRYLSRQGADRETAEEIVQETYLVAWRRADAIPTDEAGVFWLCGVARRLLANSRRAERRRNALVEKFGGLMAVTAADTAAVPPEDRTAALRGWRSLAPGDRELLYLVMWLGLDRRELARLMDCTPTAAAMRLSRARERLDAAM